jgi:hypothetical protein
VGGDVAQKLSFDSIPYFLRIKLIAKSSNSSLPCFTPAMPGFTVVAFRMLRRGHPAAKALYRRL